MDELVGKSYNMENTEDKLYCPYCGSSQLTANKKGFGVGKAVAGAALVGDIGLLAGFIGSNKVKITCLKCGKTLKPRELRTTPLPPTDVIIEAENTRVHTAAAIFFFVGMLIAVAFIIAFFTI